MRFSWKAYLFLFFFSLTGKAEQRLFSLNEINSHSGDIFISGGVYYLFGEYRTKHNNKGRTENNQKITLYKSSDFVTWERLKDPIDLTKDPNDFEVERPKVLFDRKSNVYYLFVHLQPHRKFDEGVGFLGVASSENIDGPYNNLMFYQIAAHLESSGNYYSVDKYNKWIKKADNLYRKSIPTGQEVRDYNVFNFNNNNYIIYTSEEGFSIQIAKLNDPLNKKGTWFVRDLIGERHEAPVLFYKNKNAYVILSGIHGYNFTRSNIYKVDTRNMKLTYLSPLVDGSESEIETSIRTQPAFVFKCYRSGRLIYAGDNWQYKNKNKDLSESKYSFFEIKWNGSKPYISKSSEYVKGDVCGVKK